MTVLILTLGLSVLLCGVYIRFARRWRIIDHPNARSSHTDPTPHGGGVPLMLAFLVGFATLSPWNVDFLWLVSGAVALMILGVVDDLRGLSVALRFGFYTLVAVLTAAVLSRVTLMGDVDVMVLIQIFSFAFAIMWMLNLYNFMDGIDGIAATQCVLACGAAALLVFSRSGPDEYAMFCLLLAAAHLGFLVWNWSPARLFMGDAGSIPTGFLLAGLAGYGAISGALPFACWLILLAIFVTDASATLCWRIAKGHKLTQAHRLHAYQRLSTHWGSHRTVVLLLLTIELFWLIPLAWVVQLWPRAELYLVILAYFPLLIGMAKLAKLP